jgi:hypothetical protein
VIDRLTVEVPAPGGSADDGRPDLNSGTARTRTGRGAVVPPRPLRILAVSDELQADLWAGIDRDRFGPLDLLVGCGDLPPAYLSYLEGTLRIPFVYAIGNHDLDTAWRDQASRLLPERPRGVQLVRIADFDVVVLDWPGTDKRRDRSQDRTAWREAIGLRLTTFLQRRSPLIVASHVAPHDAGDSRDLYHEGFAGYRWLAEQLRPALWLHGHTTPASQPERVTHIGPTTCVNVTGAWVIDLVPASAPTLADAGAADEVSTDSRPPLAGSRSGRRGRDQRAAHRAGSAGRSSGDGT